MAKPKGQIIIKAGINVRPHEIETARALANAGLIVEFIRKSEEPHVTSPDILINGISWEMKSPTSNKLQRIQRCLRDALKQSHNVIIDSRRMKKIPDRAIERELNKYSKELRSLERLWFVNRHGKLIVIK